MRQWVARIDVEHELLETLEPLAERSEMLGMNVAERHDGQWSHGCCVIPSVARDLGGWWLEDRASRHRPPGSLATLGMTASLTPRVSRESGRRTWPVPSSHRLRPSRRT